MGTGGKRGKPSVNHLPELPPSPLFSGIEAGELPQLLSCLGARWSKFSKGAILLDAGEPVNQIAVLLAGRAQVLREEYNGERTILAELGPGDLFGEAFACAPGPTQLSPVTVLACGEGAVLRFDAARLFSGDPPCSFHPQLVGNMMGILAEKNIFLNRKIGHLSKRTTREKLLSYLSEQAAFQGSEHFLIPFDQQQLADYLCVERSGLSVALNRLRREGVIRYRKNRFSLCIPLEEGEPKKGGR